MKNTPRQHNKTSQNLYGVSSIIFPILGFLSGYIFRGYTVSGAMGLAGLFYYLFTFGICVLIGGIFAIVSLVKKEKKIYPIISLVITVVLILLFAL